MARNPKHMENLRSPWQKGESGNPTGKPKGIQNSKTRLVRLLSLVQKIKNPVTGEFEDFSVLEQMDMKMVYKALKGDHKAYKEILDRIEGQPKQVTETTGNTQLMIKIVEKD